MEITVVFQGFGFWVSSLGFLTGLSYWPVVGKQNEAIQLLAII